MAQLPSETEQRVIGLVVIVITPIVLYLLSTGVMRLIDLLIPPENTSEAERYIALHPLFFWRRRFRKARKLYEQGNFEEASKILVKLLNRSELERNPQLILAMALMLGYCEVSLGRYASAIDSYTRATQVKPDVGPDAWFLAVRHLGYCQAQLEDFASARETFLRLSHIYKERQKPEESVRTLGSLANLLEQKGWLDEAADCFRKALELSTELAVPQGRRAILHDYALLLDLKGHTRDAIVLLREAAGLSLQVGDSAAQAETHLTLSYFLRSACEMPEADQILRKAMEMASESRDALVLAYAQHSRAILEWCRGNRSETFELLDRAEELLRTKKSAPQVQFRQLLVLLTRAWYKEESGRFDEALSILDIAEPMTTTHTALSLRAEFCRTRTLALAKSAKFEQAHSMLNSDGPFGSTRSIPYSNAQYEQAAGVVAFAEKEYATALAKIAGAAEFFERAGQKRDTAVAFKHLTMVSKAIGNQSQSDQYRNRALELFAAFGDRPSADEVRAL